MHGVLFVNPRSGRPETTEAVIHAAQGRGIDVRTVREEDDLASLARAAADEGAEVLGTAGGDGSLCPVVCVAIERGLGFVPVPAGTRNHFARDAGFDRDDPVGALAAFEGPEVRADVGSVNGRLFVNNVALGLYAAMVHDVRYGKGRLRAFRSMLGGARRLRRAPLRLVVDGEAQEVLSLLVGNNAYGPATLADLLASGGRERLDEGRLYAYLWARGERRQWACPRFRVESSAKRVKAAVDGDPVELEPPVELEVRPGALRLRVPPDRALAAV